MDCQGAGRVYGWPSRRSPGRARALAADRLRYNRALFYGEAAGRQPARQYHNHETQPPKRIIRMKLSRILLLAMAATMSFAALAQEKKTGATAGGADALVSTCIGCHAIPGYQASFPQVYRVPKIGGQSQQYIEAALKAYRQGDRKHPTMVGVAKGLTDEQIASVAAYYAQRGR